MSTPSLRKDVRLIDGRAARRRFVAAQLYRDYPSVELDDIEAQWANAREQAAIAGRSAGLAPLEHEHWDWRNKADSVETGRHMLLAVECRGQVQGLMAVLRTPRAAKLGEGQVIYVDYLESAPWNLKGFSDAPRFIGVGTVLIAEAICLSVEMLQGGRVGLHSLPQAEAFYARCGMTRIGPDQQYFDLAYFEYTSQQAIGWLESIGESP